ncbi:MAG: hypothetical protein ACE5DS_01695 [Kiloniellaceae bacterium]
MSIRSALGSLPSWPVLVIVPVIFLGVGVLYYGPAYQKCTRLAQVREGFSEAVARAARGQGDDLFLDRAVVAGTWDQVRIVPRLGDAASDSPVLDCPFGWDLDKTERRAMMQDGRLGILAFAEAGKVVDYIEYRSDRIRFEGIDEVVARIKAVFTVETEVGADGPYILRPAGPKP